MNNKCVLCEIINNPIYLEDTIIYDNKKFIVKSAKGMVVPFHYLIIPRKHINSMAELTEKNLNEMYRIAKFMSNEIKKHTKKEVVFFEHGSLSSGRHLESIVHAHFHVIAYNMTEFTKNLIINGCKMNKISSIFDIKKSMYKDYWFFEDEKGNLYHSNSVSDVLRSIIFKAIALQEKKDKNYEWREEKNNDKNKLVITIKLGKKIFKNY